MAGMTKVDVEDPYESGLSGQGVEADTLTGTGTDATEVRAGVSGAQLYICNGHVATEAAGVLQIYSSAVLIAQVEHVAAATSPLPHVWCAAGEDLNMENTDGATIHIWCETNPIKPGFPAQGNY